MFTAISDVYLNTKNIHYNNSIIKRAYVENVAASTGLEKMSKKPKASSSSQRAENQNYFLPLQTIDDDNSTNEVIEKVSKIKVPPITILKCTTDQVHEACRILNITEYSIRKISIGIKLFCANQKDYLLACEQLEKRFQFEFFMYAAKNDKPYKAVLLGLDKMDPSVVKAHLIKMGLKCIDVKIVTRGRKDRNEQIIYVVYFERKTITIKELRQNYWAIERVRIKWEYQKPNQAKPTQCHNCQMFGHGASRCKVKTFCGNCAGNHKTSDCNSTVQKCINCKGNHKSMSLECPSRSNYLEIRERAMPSKPNIRRFNTQPYNNSNHFAQQYPNSLNQGEPPSTSNWANLQHTSNNGDLFSFEEIKLLTFELITGLSKCKSRADQFGVLTNLACKFLYK